MSLQLNAAGQDKLSFLLLNEKEELQVDGDRQLAEKLGCDLELTKAKVRGLAEASAANFVYGA